MSEPQERPSGPVRVAASLIQRAKRGDEAALITIFRQFLPPGEKINWVGYLGFHGLIWGRHSLGCLTERRVADVTLGHFGEVVYQDGFLEYVNSGVVYQPSRLSLYIMSFIAIVASIAAGFFIAAFAHDEARLSSVAAIFLGAVFAVLVGLVAVNFVVRLYYAFNKCGLVLAIKGGVNVYVIADRKRLPLAMSMYRMAADNRDGRVAAFGHLG